MKNIFTLCLVVFASFLSAQDLNNLWHHKDLATDSVPGVSLEAAKAYLEGRPSNKVVVAIIDSGFELDHEALKDNLWFNEDEVAGNGMDDDQNGYVDDINGWNFIGGTSGNITNETMELTREYRRLTADNENGPSKKSKEYDYWKEIEAAYLSESEEARLEAARFFIVYDAIPYQYQLLSGYARVDTLSVEVLELINSPDSAVMLADDFLTRILMFMGGEASQDELMAQFEDGMSYYDYQGNYAYNLDFDPRDLVGDQPGDLSDRFYGNNDVAEVGGYGGSHGTHVAGIVGGSTIGISDQVEFMCIRAIPSGDERDKDVANAIRYAADNGAQIINMSFGKGYSPNEAYVQEAVQYAEKKGVLMIHAAGNDGSDNDEVTSYPDGRTSKRKKSKNWIEVGASSNSFDQDLPASFSNYGRESVDLFAPGVDIVSSMPDNTYEPNSGTSMAAPVVAGVSALLLSHFPDLTAAEIKEILVASSTKADLEVLKPGSDELVPFSSLSKTGGVINALEAVKLAVKRAKIELR
jgi:subtilisin family serine protease